MCPDHSFPPLPENMPTPSLSSDAKATMARFREPKLFVALHATANSGRTP